MRIIQIGIVAAMGLFLAGPAWADVTVDVNGEAVVFDQPPVMQGGRVLVPLRGVFEKLGATVVYQAGDRSITAQSGATSIHLQIGSTAASVNGQQQPLDQAPILVGGRALVPLRFVSQALGAQVNWNNSQQLVSITAGDASTPGQSYHAHREHPVVANTRILNITLIEVDNNRLSQDPIRPGQIVTITIHGTPHGRATFDVGGNKSLQMTEGPIGTYVGRYTAKAADAGPEAAVTVHMTDPNGKVTSKTSDQKLAFAKPTVNQEPAKSKASVAKAPPAAAKVAVATPAAAEKAPAAKDPLIRSVTHDGSGKLSVGQVLKVTMLGVPGGKASFDVATHSGIPMKEVSRGTYVGEFTAPAGEVSQNARVQTHLTMPNGATMSLAAPTSVSFQASPR